MTREFIFDMEKKFGLSHRPAPIVYDSHTARMFKLLLWYSPNPGGYQSIEEPIIERADLSDDVFDHFTSVMRLNDVKCLGCEGEGPKEVNDEIMHLEKDDPTPRLIMTYGCGKDKKQTKTMSLLNHLRNALAHGRFTLTGNSTFIGFDNDGKNYNFFLRVGSGYILNLLNSIVRIRDLPDIAENIPRGWYIVDVIWRSLLADRRYELCLDPLNVKVGEEKFRSDMTIRSITSRRMYRLKIRIMTRLPPSRDIVDGDDSRADTVKADAIDVVMLLIPNRNYVESTVERLNKIGYVLLDKSRLKGTFSGKDMLSNQLDRL